MALLKCNQLARRSAIGRGYQQLGGAYERNRMVHLEVHFNGATLAITHRIYADRNEARSDVFDYIEMFDNPKRRHSYSSNVSSV